MTFGVGHTNGTEPEDHDTGYGTGTALIIVLLGFVFVGMVIATPWFLGDEYYTPLYPRRAQQVVLVRADTPIVKGVPVDPPPSYTQATKGTGQSVVSSPGHTLISTPDLSCLKTV